MGEVPGEVMVDNRNHIDNLISLSSASINEIGRHNCKELYIEILEQLYFEKNKDKSLSLISLLRKVILCIKRKRNTFIKDSINIVFQTICGEELIFENNVLERKHEKIKNSVVLDFFHNSLSFISPFIDDINTHSNNSDKNGILLQGQLLVSFLLKLLSFEEFEVLDINSPWFEIGKKIVLDISRCFIPFHHILSVNQWRNTLKTFENLIYTDIDYELDIKLDDDVNNNEPDVNIYEIAGIKYGFYLHRSILDDDNVYSWNQNGLNNLTLMYFTKFHNFICYPLAISSEYTMYIVSLTVNYLFNLDKPQRKKSGIQLLEAILSNIQDESIMISNSSKKASTCNYETYISDASHTPWYTPLIEGVSRTMVLLPEEKYRSRCHSVFERMISIAKRESRFSILVSILNSCPFPNVKGLVLDRLRRETHENWTKYDGVHGSELEGISPYFSSQIVDIINDHLKSASDEDLVNKVDEYVSAFSLYRFIYLRDLRNLTGIRNTDDMKLKLKAFNYLSKRVNELISESSSTSNTLKNIEMHSKEDENSNTVLLEVDMDKMNPEKFRRSPVKVDQMRMLIMDAAIAATIELLSTEMYN